MEASSAESAETEKVEKSENPDGGASTARSEDAEKSQAAEHAEKKSQAPDKSEDAEKPEDEKAGYIRLRRVTIWEVAGMVSAVVLAISLFLPWYGTSSTNTANSELTTVAGVKVNGGDVVTAWQMFPILRWVLLAVVIAPFGLTWIIARGHKLDWRPGEVTMVLGIAAFVLVLCNGVILGKPGESVDISLQWGYPIALLACLGMAVAGFKRQARSIKNRKPPGTI